MKHIRIVLSLMLVVVLMTTAVFLVENELRPEIDLAAAARANEAKDEVLPGALASGLSVENMVGEEPLKYAGVNIIGIWHYEGLGYVYQVEFMGHVDYVQAAIASVAFFAPIHATIPNPILLMMSAML